MKLRSHGGKPPFGPALIVLCTALSSVLFGAYGCGTVDFLRRDPTAARDRASRFDRFVKEVTLDLEDTAPLIKRLQSGGRASEFPGQPWDLGRRESIRRIATWKALQRLEVEFSADKLDGPRSATSRVLARDLRKILGIAEKDPVTRSGELPSGAAYDPALSSRLAVQRLAATPWSGLMVELPGILLTEQPRVTARDLENWEAALAALADEAGFLSASPAALAAIESYAYPSFVLDEVIDFVVELDASAGAGSARDALFGPLMEAESALAAATGSERSGTTSKRRALQARLKLELSQLVVTLTELRARLPARPFNGSDAANEEATEAWSLRIQGAAGANFDATALADLGRSEAQRLKRALGKVLDLDPQAAGFEGQLRDKFTAIRRRELAPPGSAEVERSPEILWQTLEPKLDTVAEGCPTVLVESRTARVFERPHGRWSPFVAGNLAPAEDPLAQPATFLASRHRDPTTPSWLREAEALRYGLPGCALSDAYRRAAVGAVPRYLLVTEREVFTEGWGLYALGFAADEGLLLELDGGFGRLAQELIAFVTLVADVGLNAGRWTVQQATDYVVENTPLPPSAAHEIIVRIAADPGRPALPAIGLLRLRSLSRGVQALIGDEFVAAEFHRALLQGGPIPMSELDARIESWLAQRSSTDGK